MARAGLAVRIGSMLLATAVLAGCGDGMPSPAIRSALAEASETPTPGPCWPLPEDMHLGVSHEVIGQTGRRAQDGEERAVLKISYAGSRADAVSSSVIGALMGDGFVRVASSGPWTFLRNPHLGRFGVRVVAGPGLRKGALYLDVPISAEKRGAASCTEISTQAPPQEPE